MCCLVTARLQQCFNEAEALKPRIRIVMIFDFPPFPGFNEAEALKPRIRVDTAAVNRAVRDALQ